MAHPGGAQGNVDQARTIPNQLFDGFVGLEALLQELGAAIQPLDGK